MWCVAWVTCLVQSNTVNARLYVQYYYQLKRTDIFNINMNLHRCRARKSSCVIQRVKLQDGHDITNCSSHHFGYTLSEADVEILTGEASSE